MRRVSDWRGSKIHKCLSLVSFLLYFSGASLYRLPFLEFEKNEFCPAFTELDGLVVLNKKNRRSME